MAKRAKKSAKKLGKKSGPKDSAYVNSKEKYENCNHRFQRHYYTWNKVAEDVYGNSTKEAIGKSLSLVVLPDDIKQLLLNIDRIRLSKHVEIYDTIRVRKGGDFINLVRAFFV